MKKIREKERENKRIEQNKRKGRGEGIETKRRMEKKKENKSGENNVRKEVFWIWMLWTYCVMVCLDTNIFLDLIFFLG